MQDVCINDILPSNFDLKDWTVRGEGRKERDDVSLETSDAENGSQNVWSIPVVEKGERLEVSFEIKGEGEVDAEVLNQFHGVTFGDEVEDDAPATSQASDTTDDSADESDEPGAGFKWREDVLLRVMAANGIDESHRDDFVRHAVKFDDDDNQYLKKAEIEAAAAAWGSEDSDAAEEAEEEPAAEEATEEVAEEAADGEPAAEDATEEAPEEATEEVEEAATEEESTGKDCPICGAHNSADAINCSECGFEF